MAPNEGTGFCSMNRPLRWVCWTSKSNFRSPTKCVQIFDNYELCNT